ncbi:MAG: DUF1552 domain-containing protein [Planctomycetota bacterium]
MFLTGRAISRRALLRGAGAALSLPLLDAMLPAAKAMSKTAADPAKLKRLGYVYMPMGYNPAEWTPKSERLDELPSSLSPLANVKDQTTVITGLELKNAYPGSHATSNAAFLSAARAKRTESSDYYLGTTVDQIAARVLGRQTQLPSLELAMDVLNNVGQCDNGYACVYQNNLSWKSPTMPLPSEAHPRMVFESLFGQGGSRDERRAALRQRASLLDSVGDEMRRLMHRVGPADRRRLDAYFTSIRDVEQRIQRAELAIDDNPIPDLDRPVGVPAAYADHARLMFDLQVLAFRGDITRVVTFQLAREASTRSYPEIGVPEPHHPITHHGRNPEKLAKFAKINQFHVSLFAEFLEKLAATPEGDGTLLDHTTYLYGSGMGDGDAHDHTDLPILVAGGAGCGMRGGRHVVYDQHTPMANLHLTLLNKAGVEIDAFADSNSDADELFEPLSI